MSAYGRPRPALPAEGKQGLQQAPPGPRLSGDDAGGKTSLRDSLNASDAGDPPSLDTSDAAPTPRQRDPDFQPRPRARRLLPTTESASDRPGIVIGAKSVASDPNASPLASLPSSSDAALRSHEPSPTHAPGDERPRRSRPSEMDGEDDPERGNAAHWRGRAGQRKPTGVRGHSRTARVLMRNPSAALHIQLNKAMCETRTYREMLALVEEKVFRFDLINMSTAIHRLGKLSRSVAHRAGQQRVDSHPPR